MNETSDCILSKDEFILKTLPDGRKITVRELQLVILSIMDEIHRVCQKNDIPYGMMAGSALGAVNYKGFIPWDDDMDLCIQRKDWTRFVEAMRRDLDPEFYFQCFDTDPRYNVLIPTMKVRKRGTYVKEVNVLLANRCLSGDGVFVDIIVFDNVSENKLVDQYYRSLIRILMVPMVVLDNLGINPVFLKKRAVKIAHDYSNKYEHSPLTCLQILYPWERFLKEPVYQKCDVYPFKPIEFEGRMFYTYQNPEKLLAQWYGPDCLKKWDGEQWIEPYPIEKRKPKHIVDINLNDEKPHPKKK
jgi:lipopolysaccharide cholinephosphotransferase